MRIWIMLLITALGLQQACAQGNALDRRFGTGGKVATNTASFGNEEAYSVVCQSDGKIIAGGISGVTGQQNAAAMIRYLADGTVDAAFGNQGRVLLYPAGGNTQGFAVAIQKIGGSEHILLGGNCYNPNNNTFSVVLGRYRPNGTIDGAFGTGGVVTLPGAYAWKLIVDTAGRLLLPAQDDAMSGGPQFGVLRLLPDGTRDSSFGIAGYATRPDTVFGSPAAIALQRDGKILVGGAVYGFPLTGKQDMGIVRYLPDGSTDPSFGAAGMVRISPDTNSAELYSLAVQRDGKILACGISDTGAGNHFYVTRLLPDGTADAGFGASGFIRTHFGNSQSWANQVLVQQDDKIYAVGYAAPAGAAPPYLFAIARYRPDGTLDGTFGVDGKDTSTIGDYCGAMAATLTPGQQVVAAGWSYWSLPLGRFHDFTLMQYLTGLEVGIIGPGKQPQLLLYPNPVRAAVTVSYELAREDRLTLQLTDIAGRTVQVFSTQEKRAAGKHREVLTISDAVCPGNYMLQMAGTTGTAAVRLQVVQ